jgi:hypothetical protein
LLTTDLLRTRVLCMVLSRPINGTRYIDAIRETWGRRCAILIFLAGDSRPTVLGIFIFDCKLGIV